MPHNTIKLVQSLNQNLAMPYWANKVALGATINVLARKVLTRKVPMWKVLLLETPETPRYNKPTHSIQSYVTYAPGLRLADRITLSPIFMLRTYGSFLIRTFQVVPGITWGMRWRRGCSRCGCCSRRRSRRPEAVRSRRRCPGACRWSATSKDASYKKLKQNCHQLCFAWREPTNMVRI